MKAPKVYVIYHVASTMEYKKYKTAAAALKYAEKLGASYAAASYEYYATKIVKLVEKTNLMSGEKYMEPSNTPGYLSPSTETYWSTYMAKYYTMMVKEPGGEWAPEFGDYSRAVVADEMRCSVANVGYGYGFVKGTKIKIIATGESSVEIAAAVAKLNLKEDA